MTDELSGKRKYDRYDTDAEAFLQRIYQVKKNADYQIIFAPPEKPSGRKYAATTLNVSAQGICIISQQRLQKGDNVALEIHSEDGKKNIYMEGEVRWCRMLNPQKNQKGEFAIGIRIIVVDGKPVLDSMIFDPVYKIFWSNVLQAVLGNFRNVKPVDDSKVLQEEN